MDELKKNSYAFLFSDVEGSTRLAQQLAESYVAVLEEHRNAIRSIISLFDGKEIDTAGDSFFIIFPKVDKAVLAAVAIQNAFSTQKWAIKIGLKVRIGIHFGNAFSSTTGFTGLEVHRASRICDAGHGGQILLSKPVQKQIEKHTLTGLRIKSLGEYLLKDFDHSLELFQVDAAASPKKFPPLRTNNLELQPKVAVLPFSNLSKDPEQDYFCEGIAEEIILELGRIHGLRVVARSSSFTFKGKTMDIRKIGKRLNATVILEGTVRKQGHKFRISAELVDTNSGLNIWSGRFDREMKDVFVVQDEIARNIAKALEVRLIPKQAGGIQDRQTENIEAYSFFLKGQRFYYQFSPKSVEWALSMFQKAIEIDDEYALAYCGMVDCYAYLHLYVGNPEENRKKADEASLKAIELAPLLAEAITARGVALFLNKQAKEAEEAFAKAIKYNPHLFEAWYQYARACFVQGKLGKAARLFEKASQADPEDYQSLLLAGQMYEDLGIQKLADKYRERGIKIAENHLRLNPGDTRALYLGANGLVALGKKEKGLEWVQRALIIDPDDQMLLYNAGCIYAMLNMQDEALNCLENSVSAGLTQKGWFENDSNLDNLRDHPRFKTLMKKVK
ncbi:MAG: tetratricopeptide repeat protein [Bacteroidetes bacterium]|nr:tetratricopeptide repeat protein [Bacteroidota bacterium]